jgi:hypothetical protein
MNQVDVMNLIIIAVQRWAPMRLLTGPCNGGRAGAACVGEGSAKASKPPQPKNAFTTIILAGPASTASSGSL